MPDELETLGDFLDSGDLWGNIQAVKDYPFFTDFPPQRLNDFTDLAFGNRTLYSKFNTETGVDVGAAAQFIVMQYDKKWLGLIAVNAIDFDLAAVETEKKTETSNETETTGQQSETLNKVSAFNSEVLVTDGGTTSTETGDRDKEGQKIAHFPIPEDWTANVCFGGKEHNILFITASKSVYTLKMLVRGVK